MIRMSRMKRCFFFVVASDQLENKLRVTGKRNENGIYLGRTIQSLEMVWRVRETPPPYGAELVIPHD